MSEELGGVVIYWRPMCTYCMKPLTRLRFTRLQYTKLTPSKRELLEAVETYAPHLLKGS